VHSWRNAIPHPVPGKPPRKHERDVARADIAYPGKRDGERIRPDDPGGHHVDEAGYAECLGAPHEEHEDDRAEDARLGQQPFDIAVASDPAISAEQEEQDDGREEHGGRDDLPVHGSTLGVARRAPRQALPRLQATSADVSSELRAIDYNKGRKAAFDKMFHYWLKDMVEFYSLYCALGFNVAASKLPTPPHPTHTGRTPARPLPENVESVFSCQVG
jgi:hypothetical protein